MLTCLDRIHEAMCWLQSRHINALDARSAHADMSTVFLVQLHTIWRETVQKKGDSCREMQVHSLPRRPPASTQCS